MNPPEATLVVRRTPVKGDASYEYHVSEKRYHGTSGAPMESYIGTLFMAKGVAQDFIAVGHAGPKMQRVQAVIPNRHPKDWGALFDGITFLLTIARRRYTSDWVTEPVVQLDAAGDELPA